ncbi:MAG: hypothetical protein U0Y82_05475 [Thermoleophilia bacterium]
MSTDPDSEAAGPVGAPRWEALRRARQRFFWTPWTPRAAAIVAIALCVVGLVVMSLGNQLERAAILFAGGAAWVLLGAYHRTRFTNPMGAWAVVIGATWFVARLDEAANRTAFTIGNVISMIDVPPVVLVLVTFPLGRLSVSAAALDLETGLIDPARVRRLRALVYGGCAWAALSEWWVLFDPRPNAGCVDCVGRNYRVADIPAISVPMQLVQAITLGVIGFLAVRAFERAYRSRDPLHRTAHFPVRVGVWMMISTFVAFMVAASIGSAELARPASVLTKVGFLLLPILYGFGLYRWSELETDALLRLEADPAAGRTAVEAALRAQLRDPDLEILSASAAELRGLWPDGDSARRTPVGRDATAPEWVVVHAPRTPESDLLDRALAWARRRLAPIDADGVHEEADAWAPRLAALTDAELLTTLRLSEQRTNQQIADELVLAVGSVNNRVSRIYRKLGMDELSRRERAGVIARLGPVLVAEQHKRAAGNGG